MIFDPIHPLTPPTSSYSRPLLLTQPSPYPTLSLLPPPTPSYFILSLTNPLPLTPTHPFLPPPSPYPHPLPLTPTLSLVPPPSPSPPQQVLPDPSHWLHVLAVVEEDWRQVEQCGGSEAL